MRLLGAECKQFWEFLTSFHPCFCYAHASALAGRVRNHFLQRSIGWHRVQSPGPRGLQRGPSGGSGMMSALA